MKKKFLITITIISFALTGCIQKNNLTDKQNDMVAEYMAKVLLENDKDYKEALVPVEAIVTEAPEVMPTPVATPQPTPKVSNNNDDQNDKNGSDQKDNTRNASLSDVIGYKDVQFDYQGYKTYQSYPENITKSYFTLTPEEGNELLVITVKADNKTNKEKKLNLDKAKVNYQLDINVGSMYKPILALVENDLHNSVVKIGPKDTMELILVFEVPAKSKKTDINLIASKGDMTEIIKVK